MVPVTISLIVFAFVFGGSWKLPPVVKANERP
jgi:hypothetical protein